MTVLISQSIWSTYPNRNCLEEYHRIGILNGLLMNMLIDNKSFYDVLLVIII